MHKEYQVVKLYNWDDGAHDESTSEKRAKQLNSWLEEGWQLISVSDGFAYLARS